MFNCNFDIADRCTELKARLVVLKLAISKLDTVLVVRNVGIQTLDDHISVPLSHNLQSSFIILVEFTQDLFESERPNNIEEPVAHDKGSLVLQHRVVLQFRVSQVRV